jgi:hypothetical protein
MVGWGGEFFNRRRSLKKQFFFFYRLEENVSALEHVCFCAPLGLGLMLVSAWFSALLHPG